MAKGTGYGKWTDEQRLDYLDTLRSYIEALKMSLVDPDMTATNRKIAAKELLDAKEKVYDVENSMSKVSDLEKAYLRGERKIKSLEYELSVYRDKYGILFDNYSGLEESSSDGVES